MRICVEHVPSCSNRGAIAALVLALAALLFVPGRACAQTQVAQTVHNLTPTGPGPIRETQPAGVCVFCHTPHHANPTRALWNRQLPGVTYTLYQSSTLEAQLRQPTGSSRLCLSCHDGILALSGLRVTPPGSRFSLGPLTGKASLGTDLSDDHPISFIYDGALAVRKGQLADPGTLPSLTPLDETRQLQCTTCHNPHEDRHPKFLRMENRYGAVCTACHRQRYWGGSSHATSGAMWNGMGTNPWPAGAYPTVAENACIDCHRPHSAGHPQRLLAQPVEQANCTICHNGAVAQKNIEAEFSKPFHHPIESSQWIHDEKEDPLVMSRHVVCVDCHNPHATTSTAATPPAASGRLRGVQGVTISGSNIREVNFEYEVCLKCHGVTEPTVPGLSRRETTRNIRLKFSPSNPSYHPLAAPGKNFTIVGLKSPYTSSSIISCVDCHNNNDWTSTGTVPRGPHGSSWEPILWQQYQFEDPASESTSTYALCYQCHDRTTLLGPGTFPHDKHVVNANASCAVCHDAHGSRQNVHLINFMLRTEAGGTVVSAATSGQLAYIAGSPGHGTCYVRCHNRNHNPATY